MSEKRTTGTVRWFNADKGYGFIIVEGQKADVFVHRQQLNRSGVEKIHEGDKVSFVLNTGKKGDFATSISKEK